MSEQTSTPKKRPYRMRQRVEHVDATRQRIVDATVELHSTIGLAETTVAAIAERAGVTRLTVYRHFPEMDSLFNACSERWLGQQQPPDPGAWLTRTDAGDRLRAGLADVYRFYRDGEAMLTNLYRDFDVLPRSRQQFLEERNAGMRDILLAPFDVRAGARRRLGAVLGHALSFTTWRSLCIEQQLSNRDAVELMAKLALTVGGC